MRFGGIVIAVALLMGACSGDPEPKEPDPTPTPTSTATLPPMPEQAKQDSPEGAAAFVDHWVDVFNYASQTGDVEELSKLSSSECEGCQSYIDLYRETYNAGGYIKGSRWEATKFRVDYGQPESVVQFVASISKGTSKPSGESVEIADEAESSEVALGLTFSAGSWTTTQFGPGGAA